MLHLIQIIPSPQRCCNCIVFTEVEEEWPIDLRSIPFGQCALLRLCWMQPLWPYICDKLKIHIGNFHKAGGVTYPSNMIDPVWRMLMPQCFFALAAHKYWMISTLFFKVQYNHQSGGGSGGGWGRWTMWQIWGRWLNGNSVRQLWGWITNLWLSWKCQK